LQALKSPSPHQQHPNQEDKSGKPVYASQTRRNTSTNSAKADDVEMPDGAETEMKEELIKAKKKSAGTKSERKAHR